MVKGVIIVVLFIVFYLRHKLAHKSALEILYSEAKQANKNN